MRYVYNRRIVKNHQGFDDNTKRVSYDPTTKDVYITNNAGKTRKAQFLNYDRIMSNIDRGMWYETEGEDSI